MKYWKKLGLGVGIFLYALGGSYHVNDMAYAGDFNDSEPSPPLPFSRLSNEQFIEMLKKDLPGFLNHYNKNSSKINAIGQGFNNLANHLEAQFIPEIKEIIDNHATNILNHARHIERTQLGCSSLAAFVLGILAADRTYRVGSAWAETYINNQSLTDPEKKSRIAWIPYCMAAVSGVVFGSVWIIGGNIIKILFFG